MIYCGKQWRGNLISSIEVLYPRIDIEVEWTPRAVHIARADLCWLFIGQISIRCVSKLQLVTQGVIWLSVGTGLIVNYYSFVSYKSRLCRLFWFFFDFIFQYFYIDLKKSIFLYRYFPKINPLKWGVISRPDAPRNRYCSIPRLVRS